MRPLPRSLRLPGSLLLLASLLPLMASAEAPEAPATRSRVSSRNQRFVLEIDPKSGWKAPQRSPRTATPGRGSIETTTRSNEDYQFVTTRTWNAQGHLVSVDVEVSSAAPDSTLLTLMEHRKGKPPARRWEARLDYIPMFALVSDQGPYVATLGYSGRPGRGPSAVVLFGSEGRILWRLAVEDFLSREELAHLPPDTPEIIFGGFALPTHRFDEKRGLLILRFFTGEGPGAAGRWVEKRITLATGKVVP